MAAVAIVTGGTRGVGRAISDRLLRDGVHVVATYVGDDEGAARFANVVSIREPAGPAQLHVRKSDVSKAQACADLVSDVQEQFGRIDYVVNNAGIMRNSTVETMTDEAWRTVLDVNLSGVFFMCRAAVPYMTAAGQGRIVNITSVAGRLGSAGQANYAASKGAVHAFSRSLARELASVGVTVNCVAPGPTDTDMATGFDAEKMSRLIRAIPVGRRGHPEEVAHAVAYLLDDAAAFVTGAILHVDGGLGM